MSIPIPRPPRFEPAARRGFSAIGMLVSVIIIGFLIALMPDEYWKILNPRPSVENLEGIPDKARDATWRLMGQQVSRAISIYEAEHGRKPRTMDELREGGVDTQIRDPWGGRIYVKKGYLRSTANPKASYWVW